MSSTTRCEILSETLKYELITKSREEDHIECWLTRRKKFSSREFERSNGSLNENKRKEKVESTYLDIERGQKVLWNGTDNGDTNCNGSDFNSVDKHWKIFLIKGRSETIKTAIGLWSLGNSEISVRSYCHPIFMKNSQTAKCWVNKFWL